MVDTDSVLALRRLRGLKSNVTKVDSTAAATPIASAPPITWRRCEIITRSTAASTR